MVPTTGSHLCALAPRHHVTAHIQRSLRSAARASATTSLFGHEQSTRRGSHSTTTAPITITRSAREATLTSRLWSPWDNAFIAQGQQQPQQHFGSNTLSSCRTFTSSPILQQQNNDNKKNETTTTNHIASSTTAATSPFDNHDKSHQQATQITKPTTKPTRRRRAFVPRKAAVALTPKARSFFKSILAHKREKSPDTVGVMLNYQQAKDGQPRMVFTFDFVTEEEVGMQDEGVSLELLDDGITPKPPSESQKDGLPKLYVHSHAFLKVLGATVDVSKVDGMPCVLDGEGNRLDPNV